MSFLSSSELLSGSINLLGSTNESDGGAEDRKSPPCTVYLYTRPVVNAEGKGAAGAKHWALYFDWGYYSATYDANEDNGILKPFFREGKPVAPNNLTFGVKVVKRDLRVTPHAVDEKARGNKYNGKIYDLVMANCQIWAKELAKLLGFKLPSGQVEQVADIGLTAVTVIGAMAALATGAMKNKQ
ncbi:uncharacterized protein [Palaemon carinicauda]|uniref:uncharacterized protein n=1 Tax=Palaemon carinicauda TaxID=392227 RepID=UPI0035B6A0CE